MLNRNSTNTGFSCFECQAGVMRIKFVTYFTWIETQLITVPDFPAWVCDVCGNSIYDQKAVNVISTLLNPSTGRPVHSSKGNTISKAEIVLPIHAEGKSEFGD